MDSLKYLLTRFIRYNNLPTTDQELCLGRWGSPTTNATSKAVIGYARGGQSYVGTTLVSFNRIDLSKLFLNVSPTVAVFRPTSYQDIFAALLDRYGLPGAGESSIISECPATAIDPANPPASITITISSGRFYKGSVVVAITPKVIALDLIVINREFPLLTPRLLLSNSLMVLERKYYHYDFTFSPNIADLRACAVGWTHPYVKSWFSDMINDADVRQECGGIWWSWGSINGIQFNLYNMVCEYNGLARNYADANANYKYIAVFKDNESNGTNRGRLYLHYN